MPPSMSNCRLPTERYGWEVRACVLVLFLVWFWLSLRMLNAVSSYSTLKFNEQTEKNHNNANNYVLASTGVAKSGGVGVWVVVLACERLCLTASVIVAMWLTKVWFWMWRSFIHLVDLWTAAAEGVHPQAPPLLRPSQLQRGLAFFKRPHFPVPTGRGPG